MEKASGRKLREYAAGAFIAFGLVLLANEAFMAYFTSAGAEVESIMRDLPGLFVCMHLVGGATGGYLVGRRREKDAIRGGAITSLFAYVVEVIYNLLFVGSFENGLYAVLGFLFGGVIGAIYANYRRMSI